MKKAIVLIILFLTPLIVVGQDTDDQMETYFSDVTKRSELKKDFRLKDREELFMAIKDFVGDEETREEALKLSRELKVPYLYPYLKRDLEGEHSEEIVDLLFATKSERGIDELISEYKKTESQDFRSTIHTALITYGVESDFLKDLKKQFDKEDDPTRKSQLEEVLKFQLDLNPDLAQSEIDENWKRYFKEHSVRAVAFEVEGWNLLEYGEPTTSGIRPYGYNYKVEEGEVRFNLRDDHWQRRSFTIKAQIFLEEDTQASIGIRPEQGTWVASTTKDKWQLEANTNHTIKRYDEEWVEVVLTITDQSEDGSAPKQLVSLTVGGNELFPNGGKLNGGLRDFWLSSMTGDLYIGKIEVIE